MIGEIISEKVKEEKSKIEQLNDLLEEIEIYIEEENKSYFPIQVKKFNIFEKIFKRKEYKKYQEQLQKGKENEKKENENKIRLDNIKRKIFRLVGCFFDKAYGIEYYKQIVENEITKSKKIISQYQRASSLQELGFESEEQAILYAKTKGIDIDLSKCSVQEGITYFPNEAGKNLGFMIGAVQTDCQNIIYDKTNNKRVYELYCQHKKWKLEYEKARATEYSFIANCDFEIKRLENWLDELKNPKKVAEGKYKIPIKYLFEDIRKNDGDVPRKINTRGYLEADGKISETIGKELEQLYENPDYMIGVHGTDSDVVEEIFEYGLKESNQRDARDSSSTVLYGEALSFTNIIGYLCKNNIILTLPQNTIDENKPAYIWGCDVLEDNSNGYCTKPSNYILPEYIYGCYRNGGYGELGKVEAEFIKNDHKKERKYRYHKVDFSIKSHVPSVIDTEERKEEMEK